MSFGNKQVPFILAILALACDVLRCVANYLLGYSWADSAFILADLILRVLGALILLALAIALVISLFKRQRVRLVTAALVFVLALKCFEYILPDSKCLIIYGARNRAVGEYGLDSLRRFARDFDRLPDLERYSFALPDKDYGIEDLQNTSLPGTYSFVKSRKSGGPRFVSDSHGIVTVQFGGEPRWGFSISLNGRRIDPPRGYDFVQARASDDIYFELDR
ncbi:MAG TPA: hypothetical protein VGY56_10190 [Verrucomicrobiae bacterium]|nr:hypothetical protein [Verrucomicrobiae bacterium]